MKDVICDEAEIMRARNAVSNYTDFLCRCIDEYIEILKDVQLYGIKDELNRARLGEMGGEARLVRDKILVYQREIYKIINDYVERLEKIDKLKFPSDAFSNVSALVAKFL